MRTIGVGGVLGLWVLACSGSATPPPAPVPAPAPAAAGLDRAHHNGVLAGIASWEVQEVVADPEPAHLVILWGSPDEPKAWDWLEAYQRAGGPMREEYPFVASSSHFPGLKPGLFIVVAAAPVDRAAAYAIAAAFKAKSLPGVDLSGTYVRDGEYRLPEVGLDPAVVVP